MITPGSYGEKEPKEKCYNIHETEVKLLKGDNDVNIKVIEKVTRNRHV